MPPTAGALLADPPAIVAASVGNFALDIVERAATFGIQSVRVRRAVDPANSSAINGPLVGPTVTLTGDGQPVQFVPQQRDNTGHFLPHSHVQRHEDTGRTMSVGIAG